MKTIEAAYILPVVFSITALFILLSFRTHDAVVSNAVQYGLLTDQAASLENPIYSPGKGYSKEEISNIIRQLYITEDKPSFSACLSGNSLYLQDNTEENSLPVFFSNYERCDTIRKETAFLLKLLKQ